MCQSKLEKHWNQQLCDKSQLVFWSMYVIIHIYMCIYTKNYTYIRIFRIFCIQWSLNSFPVSKVSAVLREIETKLYLFEFWGKQKFPIGLYSRAKFVFLPMPLCKCTYLSAQLSGIQSICYLCKNYLKLSWFNPSEHLSIMQLLAHSLPHPPLGWGRE